MPLAQQVSKLRENVMRWRDELSSGNARGTHVEGIAAKAVNSFEAILHESLRYSLEACNVPYKPELASKVNNKRFDKLTLGDVVRTLEGAEEELTKRLRSVSSDAAILLKDRSLVDGSHKQRLNQINKLRRLLTHHRDEFSKDEPTLIANTKQLVGTIREELEEPFFKIMGTLSRPNGT